MELTNVKLIAQFSLIASHALYLNVQIVMVGIFSMAQINANLIVHHSLIVNYVLSLNVLNVIMDTH